jgi:hypothetical protein
MESAIFNSPALVIGFPVILFLVALAVAFFLYRKSTQDPELAWLKPYAASAVVAAFKLSEQSNDVFGERLRGADKAAVAQLAYTHLPQYVRTAVSPEQFALFVQHTFDELTKFYDANWEHLSVEFEQWQTAQKNLPVLVQDVPSSVNEENE